MYSSSPPCSPCLLGFPRKIGFTFLAPKTNGIHLCCSSNRTDGDLGIQRGDCYAEPASLPACLLSFLTPSLPPSFPPSLPRCTFPLIGLGPWHLRWYPDLAESPNPMTSSDLYLGSDSRRLYVLLMKKHLLEYKSPLLFPLPF